MQNSAVETGYCVRVQLELRVDSRVFELASVGPTKCVLREAVELPACNAEIAMFINDNLYVWTVRIPNGTVPFDKKVSMQILGEMRRFGPPKQILLDRFFECD